MVPNNIVLFIWPQNFTVFKLSIFAFSLKSILEYVFYRSRRENLQLSSEYNKLQESYQQLEALKVKLDSTEVSGRPGPKPALRDSTVSVQEVRPTFEASQAPCPVSLQCQVQEALVWSCSVSQSWLSPLACSCLPWFLQLNSFWYCLLFETYEFHLSLFQVVFVNCSSRC